MHFALYAVLAAVLLLPTPADAQERGAFIAFDGKTKDWAPVFERMHDAGMDTAIVQFTCTTSGYFYSEETDAFIHAAETAGMNYYLGLRYHEEWDGKNAPVSMYVNDSIELMTKVLPPKIKNTKHFKGWYMALEVGNDEVAVKHTEKLKEIAKKKGGRRIAMSVYFNPNTAQGKLTPKAFASAIKDTLRLYDVVLFQDSVGKHGPLAAKNLKKYYRAIDDNYPGELWMDVEAFRGNGTATEADFAKQLDAALALNKGRNIFVFEFLRNLYPISGALAAWNKKFGNR
ncbi:MAG TPA: DUF4434 domain-containing protein [Thermoanaerobaculia bacterium]|jgi:hypothetical protein